MAYLLDTNAVIALMKNHSRIVGRIRSAGRSELVICAPVEAELWFGVSKSSRVAENSRHLLTLLEWLPSLPFSGKATRLCGEIRADLARKGTPIGPYDLQIAAIALANDCTLVTHNTGELSRIAGVEGRRLGSEYVIAKTVATHLCAPIYGGNFPPMFNHASSQPLEKSLI